MREKADLYGPCEPNRRRAQAWEADVGSVDHSDNCPARHHLTRALRDLGAVAGYFAPPPIDSRLVHKRFRMPCRYVLADKDGTILIRSAR